MASTESLLDVLDDLVDEDLERFQAYLSHGNDFNRIPKGRIKNKNRWDTASMMVEYYTQSGAVEITLKILERMNQNQLAQDLRQKISLRGSNTGFRYQAGLDSTTDIGAPLRSEVERHSQEIADLRVETENLRKEMNDLKLHMASKVEKSELASGLRRLQKTTRNERGQRRRPQTAGTVDDPDVRPGISPDSSYSGTRTQTDKEWDQLLGSSGVLCEDLQNTCSVSKSTSMFEELNKTEQSTHLNSTSELKADTSEDRTQTERLNKMPSLPQDLCGAPAVRRCTPQPQIRDLELYISVQFGTHFTGYAFQFKGGQIRMPRWGSEYGYATRKTPTCVLFDEDRRFLQFGYDAVMTYTIHRERGGAQTLYYYEHFTAELYSRELHRDLMIKEKHGKEMRAMTVFSESLRFLKDDALEMIGKTSGGKYSACDATWVVTVPAECSSTAKQFMREAATEAGLVTESDPERLIVALEPEAACVWCIQLPSEGFLEGDLEKAGQIEVISRSQYMVVDCGGGAINISVHQAMAGGRLQELHKVTGKDMGGQRVDQNFKSFLREIFGDKLMDKFEKNHPTNLQRLMYEFSTCKRYDRSALVQLPSRLQRTAEKTKRMEKYFRGVSGAEWAVGAIILTGEKLRSLHEDSLRAIEHMVKETLSKPSLNISYLFLVGGFALSPHVNKLVRVEFGSRCEVLSPLDAEMAALKGALTLGMMLNVVESRLSLFSYGISVRDGFTESKHRGKSSHVSQDGVRYCDVCFHCLVEKGESVRYGEVREFTFSPVQRDQTEMRFSLYRTESRSAGFVDQPGMEKIRSVSVPMPEIRRGLNRSVRLEVRFGVTEMKVTATDIDSGETRSVKLDFMTQ